MPDEANMKGSPSILRFHDLAPNRIREILLVSSEYDAYVVEEDGILSERLFIRYSEFYMVSAPRIIHALSCQEGLDILKERRIDMVLTTLRDGELGVGEFVQTVLKLYPKIPLVLLVLDEIKLRHVHLASLPKQIAGVFLWTGDARLISAIISLVEDSLNVEEDTYKSGVQVIISVEDSVSCYSVFFMHLYEELMIQSRSLVAEGVNFAHRILRMLTRPKILLATNYEEAWELFNRFEGHVSAVISDVQFERQGIMDVNAGFVLAKACQKRKNNLPILLQSSDLQNQAKAESLGLHFADKNSEKLRLALRSFLQESLGFGDFIFRMPDRSELARAHDVYELEKLLHTVDLRSIYYHASNNHFNVWLRARSVFELADEVEKIKADEFSKVEDLRDYFIKVLQKYAKREQEGVITDITRKNFSSDRHLVKVGEGSIGGKGRGIAFMNSRLARSNFFRQFPELKVMVPRTVIVGTEVFDRFIKFNKLEYVGQKCLPEDELKALFVKAQMPSTVINDLKQAFFALKGTIIVRSSSLLEDSQHQSCAGIYRTCIIPNNRGTEEERFRQLTDAIKKVYMSTFTSRAKTYMENTLFSIEEEKMAVVIQEVVGTKHGSRFYPDFAGVGISYNYYPVGSQKTEDGVVTMCLGLGHMVAQGGRTVRFCPKTPKVLPHLNYADKFLEFSQKQFYAVDLSGKAQLEESKDNLKENSNQNKQLGSSSEDYRAVSENSFSQDDGVILCSLEQAEEDGALSLVGSVYSIENDTWRDSLMYPGPRAVTFNNILKWGAIPFPQVISALLERFKTALGSPIELEFAVNLNRTLSDENEQNTQKDNQDNTPVLYLLQIRPITGVNTQSSVQTLDFSKEQVFCRSNLSLGHGCFQDIRDIIAVKPNVFDAATAKKAAREIGKLNAKLLSLGRHYILVGSGRWGSNDPSLGIPVSTSQILRAKLIIELPYGDKEVEPSMGSHFFHELTALKIGYLTIFKGAEGLSGELVKPQNSRQCTLIDSPSNNMATSAYSVSNAVQCPLHDSSSENTDCPLKMTHGCSMCKDAGFVDLDWLYKQDREYDSPIVCHIVLPDPVEICLDGRCRKAVVLKPTFNRQSFE